MFSSLLLLPLLIFFKRFLGGEGVDGGVMGIDEDDRSDKSSGEISAIGRLNCGNVFIAGNICGGI